MMNLYRTGSRLLTDYKLAFPMRTKIRKVSDIMARPVAPVRVWNLQNMKLKCYSIKKPPWPLVHERTIPTERPPLVDEI
jgi:hypothetical protein